MPDFPVHPYAATFPMLSDDELAELALDITRNGLRHPIMLDHAGEQLLDGRNRLRACTFAGVEPRFEQLAEGIDPVDYIISVNIERRHLSSGQRALAWVLGHPERSKGGRGKPLEIYNGLDEGQRASARVQMSHAREIAAHASLAQEVMSGAKSFDRALSEARWLMANAAKSAQHQRELQYAAPDLAAAVTEGQISLFDAVMELDYRRKIAAADHKKARESMVAALGTVAAGWKNGHDFRQDEAFRAALIDRLKIEPADLKAFFADIGRAVSKTG